MSAQAGAAIAEFSISIEIDGGRVVVLVEEGTPLPAHARRLFTTVSDGQAAVDINILTSRASGFISMGRFLLSGISNAHRGDPRIEIVVEVDIDGIVRASAYDMDTDASQAVTFSTETTRAAGGPGLKGRILSLITRVRIEARMLAQGEHAALVSEIQEIMETSFASIGTRDAERMSSCLTALETVLGEIHALVPARTPSARRGARHG